MSGWVPAERSHRALLSSFTCVEKGPAPGPGTYHIKHKPWARKAQSLIRNAEAPTRLPDHTFILVSDDATRIEAAFSFFAEELAPGALRIHLNVLARHLDCAGARYGDMAYERFQRECISVLDSVPSAAAAILTAEAHTDNLPVQRLIQSRGWQCTGPVDAGGYAPWALPLEIK